MKSISTFLSSETGGSSGFLIRHPHLPLEGVDSARGRLGREPGKVLANRSFYHARAVALERKRPGIERLRADRLAQLAGETKVVVQVVQRIEAGAEDLVHLLQMVKVSAGEICAGVATARFVERSRVRAMFRISDADVAEASEQVS